MSHWFAIVDGAADPRLHNLIVATKTHDCLYSGDYAEATRKALPYIVQMRNGERFSKIWSDHETGNYWGILCKTDLPLAAFRRHLRHFTTARLPDGEVVMFRFWDPRVFSTFAENGTAEEVEPFLENISTVLCDLGKEGRKQYRWNDGLQMSGMKTP